MKKLDHIVSTFILSATLPMAAFAAPVVSVSGTITSGGASSVSATTSTALEQTVTGSVASSLGDMCRAFVADLMSDGASSSEAPSDPIAAQVARARAIVAAAPKLAFERTQSVDKFVHFYTDGRGRKTMRVGVERSHALRDRAESIFAEEGVPPRLVWLAQVESVWNDTANSHVGAAGVWQFMPETGERFGLKQDGEVDERNDFEKATRAAAKYLRILGKRYSGNWELAIGAYNCGEGNMDKAIEKAGVADFWAIADQDLLPEETKNYVPKVLAASIVGHELSSRPGLSADATLTFTN